MELRSSKIKFEGVWCCVKKCNFRLYFATFPEKEKTFDELNFSLESFKDTPNHPLTASEEHTFNQEIIKEIDCLKGKMKTKGGLQDHINNIRKFPTLLLSYY